MLLPPASLVAAATLSMEHEPGILVLLGNFRKLSGGRWSLVTTENRILLGTNDSLIGNRRQRLLPLLNAQPSIPGIRN